MKRTGMLLVSLSVKIADLADVSTKGTSQIVSLTQESGLCYIHTGIAQGFVSRIIDVKVTNAI